MCRLAAFPPGTTYPEAVRIATSLEGHNIDGVGTAHVLNGQFIIKKFPITLSSAIEKKLDLFSHMPHAGWTVLHTRLATHGDKKDENTHPFEIGDYAFAHNGVWSDSEICRFALEGHHKFIGETDSEVAGYFFNRFGPDLFAKRVTRGGVFFGLHRNGELHIVKTYGDLQVSSCEGHEFVDKPKGLCVLASELTTDDVDRDQVYDVDTGVIKMAPDGTAKEWGATIRKSWKSNYNGYSSYLPFAKGYRSDDHSDHRDKSETKKIITNSGQESRSINFWQLDPSNYVCDMIGDD